MITCRRLTFGRYVVFAGEEALGRIVDDGDDVTIETRKGERLGGYRSVREAKRAIVDQARHRALAEAWREARAR